MKKSMVDILAEQVGKKASCEVIVHRLVNPDLDRIGRVKVGMYRIEVKRGIHSYSFGDMKVAQAKQSLAMIADMMNMGFIRVIPEPGLARAASELLYVSKILDNERLAGMDQNPHGWRDLLYSAAKTVETIAKVNP